ncbi:MAG: site-2 protease family protein, partial [Anaerolineae bacterium]
MSVSFLSMIVFVLVFAGVILIHELGHFLVARLFKIEVEEFGFGLPPRALTLYRQKGYLLLKSGKRIEIPAEIGLPLPWSSLIGQVIPLTVQQVNGQWILRTLDITSLLQQASAPAAHPLKKKQIVVNEHGQALTAKASPQAVIIGKQAGEIDLNEEITEVHPGTEFTLNWLPLGGFVRPKGENDP